MLCLYYSPLKESPVQRRPRGAPERYNIPEKCVLGYYPECNVLIPLWHYAKESKVPAAKSVPVRISLQQRGDG
jgi:hypothetical protein